jgi:hypothetical protein
MYGSLPYIRHPEGVALYAREAGFGSITIATALLHDVIEDTEVTARDLVASGIPPAVVVSVMHLSSTKGESSKNKLRRARLNPNAHAVKCFDAQFNHHSSVNDPPRQARYAGYLATLGARPTPMDVDDYVLLMGYPISTLEDMVGRGVPGSDVALADRTLLKQLLSC